MEETIIKKAIEGGWQPKEYFERYYFHKRKGTRNISIGANPTFSEIVLDITFWQSLIRNTKLSCTRVFGGKYCVERQRCSGCGKGYGTYFSTIPKKEVKEIALRFHEINLTEGWDKAIEYLTNLIK